MPPAKSSNSQQKKVSTVVKALPKGAVDEGEQPDQTALREINEETGLSADLIDKLADIKYVYVRQWGDHARFSKLSASILLLYRSGRIGNISPGDADRGSEGVSGSPWKRRPRLSATKANAKLPSWRCNTSPPILS